MSIQAVDYIDTQRYPIEQAGETRTALVAGLRADLETNGCAVLKGFIRADRLAELVAESDRVAVHGHRNFNRTNAYFTQDQEDLPQSHPLRRFYDRSNAFVPADNFGADSILRHSFRRRLVSSTSTVMPTHWPM
jgi:hypothetical protein